MTTRYWITYERTERRLRRPPLSGLWYGLVSIGVGNAALGVFTSCAHFLAERAQKLQHRIEQPETDWQVSCRRINVGPTWAGIYDDYILPECR